MAIIFSNDSKPMAINYLKGIDNLVLMAINVTL